MGNQIETSPDWEAWRGYVSGDEDEDLADVFKHVRIQAMLATQMKWARDWRTQPFCDLGLYLIYENHIRRVEKRDTEQSRIFANVQARELQHHALHKEFFVRNEDREALSVDRFNDTWGLQSAYCRDLIAYLFRPTPYLRRLKGIYPELLRAAETMPLGAWIRHTSATELASVLGNPLVSLHTFIETVLPTDTEVRQYVHRLRRLRLQEWASLYETVFTAYGAPLRSDRDDLDWLGLAERFSTAAGGAFVRAQTRPVDEPVDATLLGQMVIEILPSLLDIDPSDIETRSLQEPTAAL
ncbi:hypothetical protein ACFYWY_29345 [Streptomyces sp. NPDC002870]|uniref:hypothetical protein n=1 Tax=Streptomyces sp. NPDC002870 TaxID=3364666 RepID=UPI0036AEEB0A